MKDELRDALNIVNAVGKRYLPVPSGVRRFGKLFLFTEDEKRQLDAVHDLIKDYLRRPGSGRRGRHLRGLLAREGRDVPGAGHRREARPAGVGRENPPHHGALRRAPGNPDCGRYDRRRVADAVVRV